MSSSSKMSDSILYVVTIGIVLLQLADYFVAPKGIPLALDLRNWLLWSSQFAVFTSAGILVLFYVNNAKRRAKRWESIFTFGIGLIVSLALGLLYSVKSPLYLEWFNAIYNVGVAGITGLQLFYFASGMFRSFNLKTKTGAYFLILFIICVGTASPLWDLIFQPGTALGNWLVAVPGAGTSQALWFATYMGTIVIVARILLGKEKLRPT